VPLSYLHCLAKVKMSEERQIRKRRRPALSCAECRRRKVKCDRTSPCGPCTSYKSPTCTYTNTPASTSGTPITRTTNRTTSTSASNTSSPSTHRSLAQVPNTIGNSISYASSVQSPHSISSSLFARQRDAAYSDADSSHVNTTLAPFNERPQRVLPDRGSQRSELTGSRREVSQPKELRTSSFTGGILNPTHRTAIPGLRGMLSKTRLYAPSHWMNYYEHVCECEPIFTACYLY
jgi:hypothetical protein